MSQPKRRGRPVEKSIAERIPDTPGNIARSILGTAPKKNKDWKYLKGRVARRGTNTKR